MPVIGFLNGVFAADGRAKQHKRNRQSAFGRRTFAGRPTVTERAPKKRIRFLSRDQEGRLLGSYAPHVRPIAEALCFQGLRVGEALRVDWTHVDWAGNSLFVVETKTGDPRSVTLHPTTCTGSG
jgi:integrase